MQAPVPAAIAALEQKMCGEDHKAVLIEIIIHPLYELTLLHAK